MEKNLKKNIYMCMFLKKCILLNHFAIYQKLTQQWVICQKSFVLLESTQGCIT